MHYRIEFIKQVFPMFRKPQGITLLESRFYLELLECVLSED
jgi:hypothetical protein